MNHLTPAFAVDVASYAVMCNHYHLVLRVDTRKAAQWSWQQVIEQWHTVYNGNMFSQHFRQGETLPTAERKILQRFAEGWRERLSSILSLGRLGMSAT